MFESLLVTLREGIEAALVIGIILAYLDQTGRRQLNKYVKWGLLVAVGASIAGAALFNSLGIDPDNKVFEGAMYLAAGVFVISMVVWMWRTSGNLRKAMTDKLDRITIESGNTGGIGLMLFTFFMVFREGVETVLFISALGKDNSPAANLTGAAIGLALAVIIGCFLVYGGARVNFGLFFKVTGIALVMLSVKLLLGGVLEFGEAGIIPLGHEVEEILELIAEGTVSEVLSSIVVALPLGVFTYKIIQGIRETTVNL